MLLSVCYDTLASFIYVLVLFLDNNCTYNDVQGKQYLGHLSVTASGYTCSSWTLQRPYRDHAFPEGSVKGAENFCRNPKPATNLPWCYYRGGTGKGSGVGRKSEKCGIGSCCKFSNFFVVFVLIFT